MAAKIRRIKVCGMSLTQKQGAISDNAELLTGKSLWLTAFYFICISKKKYAQFSRMAYSGWIYGVA